MLPKYCTPNEIIDPVTNKFYTHLKIYNISGSVVDEKVYIYRAVHPNFGRKNKGKTDFDFRIGPTYKYINFGTEGDYGKFMKLVVSKLLSKEYESVDGTQVPDISDYGILGDGGKCKVTEIDDSVKIDDNTGYRPYHLLLPREKSLYRISELVCNEYKESCKYGTNRIGNLDVAEGHLLKYEE